MKYKTIGLNLDRDFRNDLNQNFGDIDNDVKKVDNRVSNIVAQAGNDNTEIVDARGGAPVLRDRLDSVDTQLAHRVQQIDNLQNYVDAEFPQLAKQNEVDVLPIKTALLARLGRTIVTPPSSFNWQDAPITIYRNRIGEFSTDFDVENFKPSVDIVYYVDPINGHANNDGLTPETALNAIYRVYNKPGENIEIRLAPFLYTRTYLYSAGFVLQDRNVVIKPMNDGDEVILSVHDSHNTLNWVLNDGSTKQYKTTRTNIGRIFDAKFKDKDGDYSELVRRNSVQEVENNPGSCFIDGSTLHIHLKDSRVPDAYVRPYFNNISGIDYKANNHTLYLENIKIEGGLNALWAKATTSSNNTMVIAKNCEFKYNAATTHDCLDIDGTAYAFFQKCVVAKGFKDGFGYHRDSGSPVKSIEVDCIGRGNGSPFNSGYTDNGTTQHNGGKGIRVNCMYYGNRGSNIGDTHVGTQSWNLGCIPYDSSALVTNKYHSNISAHDSSQVWIDGCLSFDSTVALLAQNNAKAYVRNSALEGEIRTEGTGEIINY